MKLYRKYVNEEQLLHLATQTPSWGVDILTIGYNIHQAHRTYPDPDHPDSYCLNWSEGRMLQEFQLVYIANGHGVFESETTPPTLVEGGMAFLLFPGVWHRYQPTYETGWEEYWVGFRGSYAEYLMRQECFNPQQPLMPIGFRSELLSLFTRLIDTLKYEGPAYQQTATCQVIQLLGMVYTSALLNDPARSRREQLVHQVRYEIQSAWNQDLDMRKLAEAKNVSYAWLRKAFKEVVGVAPGQYYLNLKIDKAIHLLHDTDLSVSEVAYQTGFESLFHFSRIFRRKTGRSPSESRTKKLLPNPAKSQGAV